MLKQLFTSQTRAKLLSIFLLNSDEEFFVRELTRKLDEQINSVRRELDNLKKIGLLRSRVKSRKKFFVVNKNFILFHDLKNIIVKCMNSHDTIVKRIQRFGNVDFLLMSGVFVDKLSSVDLLIVGEVDREKLEHFLNTELDMKRPLKFTILSKDDFLYRLKCKDKFIRDLLEDSGNIIGLNTLDDLMTAM
ncbi:hypothetical protein HYV57_05395 [Candidatus Peregrinibacteria bacterium]|nr:hypothetical protein [Candidatus Peregrinibacteria bacterium]